MKINKIFDNDSIINQAIFVFFIALILRIGYIWFFVDSSYLIQEDQGGYVQLGQTMAKSGDFFKLTDGAHTGRLPVYPTFLAIIFKWLGGNNITVVMLQAFVDSFTCVVVGLIVKSIIHSCFVIAGLISAINLNMIIHSGMILPDTLFLLLFSIFILFISYYLNSSSQLHLFLSVFFLSGATLIRPVSYFFIFLFLALLIVRLIWKDKKLKEILISTLVYLISVLILLGPIIHRNYNEYSSFSLTNQGGVHALQWVVPSVYQYSGQGSYKEGLKFAQKHLNNSIVNMPDNFNNNPFKTNDHHMKVAKQAISELGLLNVLHAWSVGTFINLLSPSVAASPAARAMDHPSFYNTSGKGIIEKIINYVVGTNGFLYLLMIVIGSIFSMVFLVVSLFGLFRMVCYEWLVKENKEVIIFLLFVMTYFIVITGPIIGVKYRLPIEPIMTIFIVYVINMVKYKKNNSIL